MRSDAFIAWGQGHINTVIKMGLIIHSHNTPVEPEFYITLSFFNIMIMISSS